MRQASCGCTVGLGLDNYLSTEFVLFKMCSPQIYAAGKLLGIINRFDRWSISKQAIEHL
jgi:hypothetical protein